VGPTNQNVVGIDRAARNIVDLILGCSELANCAPGDYRAVVLGLAGAGGDPDRARLRSQIEIMLAEHGVTGLRLSIETDARIALEGAFAGGPGIVLIAGTGSVVLGKSTGGKMIRVGGWGRGLGDDGSGYHIGYEALRAVTREIDGMGSSGMLRELIASRKGLDGRQRIITAVYREKLEFSTLAPLVLEGAETGDPVCIQILEGAARFLAEQVFTIKKAMSVSNEVGLVFYGGLIDHETAYARILTEAIKQRCPDVHIRPAMHSAAHGAVLMALDRIKEN
jgi:N-acetylglucosamine kinase-like BadF-type ATPase